MANELVPMGDLEKMAAAVAKSGLFGSKSPDHAMALMLLAQAEGLHPMAAVQQFHIVNGQPARKAWSMLERFQTSGGKVEWHERTDQKVSATFTHPQGGSVTIDWDHKRAQQAGINNPMWKKYPRQMLTARVISEGVRTVFPGATGGMYVEEEVADMKDVTPPRRADGRALPSEPAKIDAIDPETGEVLEEADPMPQEGPDMPPAQPELTQEPSPADRAETWGNKALGFLEAAPSLAAVVSFEAKNRDRLEEVKAANLNVYALVAKAIQDRKAALSAGA